MSIVSFIRDYVELLNNLSDSLGSQLTSTKFITVSFFYFLETLKYSVYYIFSLQWLHDFTLLPITIPQNSQAIFSENLFLETPKKVFFEFLEIPSLYQNKFVLGFFNSFFLTLPITVTHIISIRRLIIQGIPAAFFSFLGFIIGQTLFILCVIFGIRSILIPWLSLEPLNYIIGLILIFQIIYKMVRENLIVLNWNNDFHKTLFKKFFLSNLILSWCEQSCIFQYFSNITLTGHPSILEGFSTKTTLASFFSHTNYILGIFLGSIVFSVIWMFLILQIKNLILSLTRISPATFIQNLNRGTFIVVIGFSLSSIPFYGFDYLVTGPLGFVSQDNVFKNTFLGQNEINDPIQTIYNPTKIPFDFDVSPFDRGRYLVFPERDDLYSFEDLNYRGELDWVSRFDKKSSIGHPKARFLSIGKFFKIEKKPDVNKGDIDSVKSHIYSESNSILPEKEILQFNEVSGLEERFDNWYDLQKNDRGSEMYGEEFIDDAELKSNAMFLNLDSFSSDFLRQDSLLEATIEKKIKQKYYSNPIYKNLLALDIDLFLNRQPNSSFLNRENELDLYEKRQILNSYYDSLRWYSKLPYYETFENFFDGTKSFSNKIYNQQFKGTLRSIRRLFFLSETSTDLISTKLNNFDFVLKYDQPLYESNLKFSPYHEEVKEIPEFGFLDQNFEAQNGQKNSTLFLKDFISKPLYAGWDENLRKFVITNKLLPRSIAGYEIPRSKDWYDKFSIPKTRKSQVHKIKSKKIKFTVWPKSELEKMFNKGEPELPFVVLFTKTIDTLDNYTSLPSNLKNVKKETDLDLLPSQKAITPTRQVYELAPKRGGFVWPGKYPFDFQKIDFQNINFQNIFK
jgi:hypothetical protein